MNTEMELAKQVAKEAVMEIESDRSFAMDLLQEFKALNKRLFIIILVLVSLWFATIGGFVLFLNQYTFESYDYTQDGSGYNNINTGSQGDVINGAEAENQSNAQEK